MCQWRTKTHTRTWKCCLQWAKQNKNMGTCPICHQAPFPECLINVLLWYSKHNEMQVINLQLWQDYYGQFNMCRHLTNWSWEIFVINSNISCFLLVIQQIWPKWAAETQHHIKSSHPPHFYMWLSNTWALPDLNVHNRTYCSIHKIKSISIQMSENLTSQYALADTGMGAERHTTSLQRFSEGSQRWSLGQGPKSERKRLAQPWWGNKHSTNKAAFLLSSDLHMLVLNCFIHKGSLLLLLQDL